MDTARYVFGVLVVTCLPPGLLWWFLVHPFVGFWRRIGPGGTIAAMSALGIVGVVALMKVRDQLLLDDYGTHPWLVVVAIALAAVSVRIAILRKKYLTIRILVGVPELEAGGKGGHVMKEGIYGRIRHPRYVEIVLGTAAYAIFANYLGAYVITALTIPAIHLIVLLEERELIARFGAEYEAYMATVPRYIPRRG